MSSQSVPQPIVVQVVQQPAVAASLQQAVAAAVPPAQHTPALQQLGNVALAMVPIGSDGLTAAQSTVVTNPLTQMHLSDPNDPSATVM